ncbi:hypothetical protein NDU88_005636 [Pleurodeles waltl]|uniref:Uncharacterized protein n=1 Tax=Pleurodeles waltl TaxID=8319 RepID=A0AAV7WD99_PLEWA|nr:hypothetical protein NDU88_005636 [Pleurodeles waltl]
MKLFGLTRNVLPLEAPDTVDHQLVYVEDCYNSLPDWGQDIHSLLQDVINLGDLARKDNVQIYGVLEESEKDRMIDYLTSFLPDLLHLQLRGLLSPGRHSLHPIIACALHNRHRSAIFSAAHCYTMSLFIDVSHNSFLADSPTVTNSKDQCFLALHLHLQWRSNKYSLMEADRMVLMINDATRAFRDPGELKLFLDSLDDPSIDMTDDGAAAPPPGVDSLPTENQSWDLKHREPNQAGFHRVVEVLHKDRHRNKSMLLLKQGEAAINANGEI